MYIYIKKKTCKPKKVFPTSFLLKKFIAKTVDEDPVVCQRWISRKEISSNQLKYQEQKTRSLGPVYTEVGDPRQVK